MEHQAAERAGAVRVRVGERLAAERQAQGIALPDIAARTRIPLRTLEMLEAGSTAGLPALTYTAGFVRSYANALGLDGAECARQFRAEMGQAPPAYVPDAYEPADPTRVPSKLLAIVALIVAVVIAGAYAVWRGDGLFGGGATERARLAAGTDVPPNAIAPAPPVPGPALSPVPVAGAVAPDGPVVVAAKEPVWLKIYERDGKTLYMGTMATGQRFEVPAGAADPLIRTGRAQALTVSIGGTPVATIGPADTLVKDRSLKRDALLAPAPLVPADSGTQPLASPTQTP